VIVGLTKNNWRGICLHDLDYVDVICATCHDYADAMCGAPNDGIPRGSSQSRVVAYDIG
jgi:hypothetical protein